MFHGACHIAELFQRLSRLLKDTTNRKGLEADVEKGDEPDYREPPIRARVIRPILVNVHQRIACHGQIRDPRRTIVQLSLDNNYTWLCTSSPLSKLLRVRRWLAHMRIVHQVLESTS